MESNPMVQLLSEKKPERKEIIRLEHITKRFGGVVALEDVSICLNKGEIHAIVGENGAGKSTLMKLLAGVQKPDSGEIFVNGKREHISSPRVAERLGISMVFQELNLFNTLSIAGNIFISNEIRTGGIWLNEKEMSHKTKEVLDLLKVDFNPQLRVGTLSVGQKQIVEIARAISVGTKVVIMDEPNSALNEHETKTLFSIIQTLKDSGITVMYVSHRLEEVFAIADRISVLRDGHFLGTWEKDTVTVDEIVTKMVGRKLGDIFPEHSVISADQSITLRVKNLKIRNNQTPVSFYARHGEVLGFAGLEGSGVQDIFYHLFGLAKGGLTGDEIEFKGESIKALSPRQLINRGWAYIPANRRDEGLMVDWSIRKNVSLVILRQMINKLGLIDHNLERQVSDAYIYKLKIATDNYEKKVNDLSGGNQQKVVLARWLASHPKLLILNDPTRGIDVGTKQDIYNLIQDWAKQGFTILLTSSEIEEIMGLSNRILVFYKGRIIQEFENEKTSKEEVMRYVLGGET